MFYQNFSLQLVADALELLLTSFSLSIQEENEVSNYWIRVHIVTVHQIIR